MRFPFKTILSLILASILFILMYRYSSPYEDLSEEAYISPMQGSIKIVTPVYFVFDGALHPELRRIEVENGLYERAVLEALSLGANNSQYTSIFDYGFTLVSVENINNTCYVNLAGDLTDDLKKNRDQLALLTWSITNTLSELKNVYRVQFMVNGMQIDDMLLGYSLANPLPRVDQLIYQKKRQPDDVVIEFVDYLKSGRYDLAYGLLSTASYTHVDFTSFTQITTKEMEKTAGFTRQHTFTKVFDSHYDVYIKFIQEHAVDGFKLHVFNVWRVIQEEEVYKIDIKMP